MSILRFIPKSSEAAPIDWSKVPEKSKQYFLDFWAPVLDDVDEDTSKDTLSEETSCEDISNEDTASKERVLPQTIGGLVKYFDGARKFISYFTPELIQFLIDIGKFGLKPEKSDGHGCPVGPRFYMKFDTKVWFLLFAPGEKEGGVCGFSAKLPDVSRGIEDWDAAEAAEAEKDREVAENFDKKLVDEVSRLGNIQVFAVLKSLAGWEAFTFKSCLEKSQLADTLMTLPQGHPVYVELLKDILASWRR